MDQMYRFSQDLLILRANQQVVVILFEINSYVAHQLFEGAKFQLERVSHEIWWSGVNLLKDL